MSFEDGVVEAEGVLCWRDPGEGCRFHYLPAEPGPQLDAQGRPTLGLVMTSGGGFLQLTARWDVSPEELDRARAVLAERLQLDSPSRIVLAPAPLRIREARLELEPEARPGSGAPGDRETATEPEVLGVSTTSGLPPYAAAFAPMLSAEQGARVREAMLGTRGRLMVRYVAELDREARASVHLQGRADRELAALAGPGQVRDLETARALVESAVEAGDVVLEAQADPLAPETLLSDVESEAFDKAAEVLLSLADQGPGDLARVEAEVSRSTTVHLPVTGSADVAGWLAAGEAGAYVTGSSGVTVGSATTSPAASSPGASSPAPPAPGEGAGVDRDGPAAAEPAAVELSFDPKDAPIAFIRAGDDPSLTLAPPGFSASGSPGLDPSGRLHLEVQTTGGGAPFETWVAASRGPRFVLDPADLGLLRVVVDGEDVREQGIRRARVWVRFVPADGARAEEQTVYLREGEWRAVWWIVTRMQPRDGAVAGVLEYEVKLTHTGGSLQRLPRQTSDEAEIRLQLPAE